MTIILNDTPKMVHRSTSKGTVIKEFTSDAEGTSIKGIPKGEYTLHEVSAPEGYEAARDVNFTIGDESVTVIMVDEFKSIKLPFTGGTPLNMLMFAVPSFILGGAFFVLGRRKSRKA